MTFGQYVRDRRTAKGLSLRQLAAAVGIGYVYLGDVERGRRHLMAPERWPALAEGLGVPLAEVEAAAKAAAPHRVAITGPVVERVDWYAEDLGITREEAVTLLLSKALRAEGVRAVEGAS